MISFDPKMRNEFEEAKKNQSSVAVRICVVKRGRSDELEILLNGRSSMIRSPKKFKIPDDEVNTVSTQCPVVATLEEVKDLAEHQKITITGKILSISKPEQIVKQRNGKQLRKQDFAIDDSTGALRGVAWESHVGVLNEDSSYKISCVTVRSFNGANYISVSEKSSSELKDNIGDIVWGKTIFDGSGHMKVLNAEILGE